MKYLAIDTASTAVEILISVDGKLTFYRENDNRKASECLLSQIDKMLDELHLTLADFDYYGVVVGPGSFTGIRIGVSTVKALCLAYGKKCLGVTSFDTLAYDIKSENTLAVIDAKHGNYYICGYKGNEKVIPESFVTTEELTTLCKGYTVVSFTDIPFEHKKADILNGLIKAVEEKQDNLLEDINALTPVYIRKSQAEENR